MDVSLTAAYLDSLEFNEKLRQDSPPQSVHQDLEFEFPAASCNLCNGYYGPNFGEPVCITCHAFLFPDYASTFPTSCINSEKTDDGDSGNDEPSDLNYPAEKRLNISQNNIPLWLLDQNPNNNNHDDEIPVENNIAAYKNMIFPHQLPNIENRLEMLSNAQPNDQMEPGLVQKLPPEVLLCIFKYLDDLSLCSVSMVCRQWRHLLKAHVSDQNWSVYISRRWPLYRSLINNDDKLLTYRSLMTSCFCYTCLVQMAVQSQPIGEENSWRRERLRNELKIMHNDPPEGIAAIPLDNKCCHWQASLTGPIGSPYEGGIFYLYIQVPYSYPLNPPVVRFLTKILHPNVSRHGDVGIDSIHHNWSLALTITKVLISVQSLLTDPYTQVCMEPSLGHMYVNDRKRFEHLARQWTWKYAMHDVFYSPCVR
ncbi:modifier of rpr and grim, ubiquitously expressed [Arctopsyche grandis]|uniref:modifier of rpr and grim, ubiquitously expressed n=1 Tax=Arctopsyche grandis TaxID=121162 RepID=UPI00406D811D